jgi:hypothetical protein
MWQSSCHKEEKRENSDMTTKIAHYFNMLSSSHFAPTPHENGESQHLGVDKLYSIIKAEHQNCLSS